MQRNDNNTDTTTIDTAIGESYVPSQRRSLVGGILGIAASTIFGWGLGSLMGRIIGVLPLPLRLPFLLFGVVASWVAGGQIAVATRDAVIESGRTEYVKAVKAREMEARRAYRMTGKGYSPDGETEWSKARTIVPCDKIAQA